MADTAAELRPGKRRNITRYLSICLVAFQQAPICLAQSSINRPTIQVASSLASSSLPSFSSNNVERTTISVRGGGSKSTSTSNKRSRTSITTTSNNKKTKKKKNNNDADSEAGKASVTTSVFNLANNVAGAGILTLAAGKARSGTGWVPSILLSVVLATVSAHTFGLIGTACEWSGQSTFKGVWAEAFEPSTAWIVDSMVFCQCFLVCALYTGLLGDIFSVLLKAVPPNNLLVSIVPTFVKSRTGTILAATTCILWPLNMIRDMSALAFTSILGLIAVLYTVVFVLWRALDGTYSITSDPVGRFVASVAHTPSFAESTMFHLDLRTLILASNLGLAFIAHYNGPSYWQSLANATSARFSKVSFCAYAVLALLYVTIMAAGYATFGDACQGNILLNYAPDDILSTLGRLATGVSLLFGFPLVSKGAREGLKNACSALGWTSLSDEKNHFMLVTSLLVVTTALALVVRDIALVSGLTGALMGSALVYVCPPLLYARIAQKKYGKGSVQDQQARRNLLLIPFGCFTAALGVAMTLKNASKS